MNSGSSTTSPASPACSPRGRESRAHAAGERSVIAALLRSPEHPEVKVKEADQHVCCERMGMGDLEVADEVMSVEQAGPPGPGPSRPRRRPGAQPLHFCCAEWQPAKDSSDEDVPNSKTSPRSPRPCCVQERNVSVTTHHQASRTRYETPHVVRSKLSVTNVSLISLPAYQDARMSFDQDDDDVEDDVDEDDEMTRCAPTPDNTPEHTPSEERQQGVVLGPGSELFSTLKGMADEAQESTSASTSSAGSTLGRVWSRIMSLGVGGGSRPRDNPQQAPQHSPRIDPSDLEDDDDDGDQDDDDNHGLRVEPQTIEELEATLEEVRLDGDADDPVVSYLVEEVEDAARPTGGVARELTVEEVHEEEGRDADKVRDDGETTPAADGGHDGELGELRPPGPKASGLLSRLFSRSRMSQDVAAGTGTGTEASKKTDRGVSGKRAGKETLSRDPLLHLHRMKSRQPKSAMRNSLPRILSRWLRQGEGGAVGGVWGPEGDAGEAVLPSRLQRGHGRGRRGHSKQGAESKTQQSHKDAEEEEPLEKHGTCLCGNAPVGKKLAHTASQTDDLQNAVTASVQMLKDFKGVETIITDS